MGQLWEGFLCVLQTRAKSTRLHLLKGVKCGLISEGIFTSDETKVKIRTFRD